MGVDLVLCGHDHQESIDLIERTEKGMVISTAGTVSNRSRGGRPSSVNAVRLTPSNIEISTLVWSSAEGAFAPGAVAPLSAMSAIPRLPPREHQLEMEFPAAPARVSRLPDVDAMLTVLCALGLRSITRCRLTRNRTVMVSFRGSELRVHEAFLEAPPEVLQAIVAFVQGRGVARRRAKRLIVEYPIGSRPAPLRREQTHPDDMLLVARLLEMHARCNRDHFDSALGTPAIRVSRRMRSALGSYHPARPDERGAEIVISRRHIRRHGWVAARETLLHEMVHQWQEESRTAAGSRITVPSESASGRHHRVGQASSGTDAARRPVPLGMMRPLGTAAAAAGLGIGLWAGARGIGPLPPLGGLLDPANGAWAAARFAELPGDGEVRIPHLSAPVDVRYDRRGVPHIFAATESDAVRALGYVVARDRLFQLDLQTHAAAGRLTEWAGPRALDADREMRELGLPRAAEREIAALAPDDDERRLLDAYADGVNACVDGLSRAERPIEYKLLGARPSGGPPSTPSTCSTGWGGRWPSSRGSGSDCRPPEWWATAPPARCSRSMPSFRNRSSLTGSGRRASTSVASRRRARPTRRPWACRRPSGRTAPATTGRSPATTGRWRRDGPRDGHALLAGDPHLQLTLPSIWYEVHLVVPGRLDVYGVTIPGVPGIVIGFNRDVAWSFTNTGADVRRFLSRDRRRRGAPIGLPGRRRLAAARNAGGDVSGAPRARPSGPTRCGIRTGDRCPA